MVHRAVVGLGAAYLVMGLFQVVTGQATELLWMSFVLGVLYLVNGGIQFVMYRRASAEAQVQDRAESR